MPFVLPQGFREDAPPYVFFDSVFSPDECDHIIAGARRAGLESGPVGVGGKDSGRVDPNVRRAQIRWVPWGPESDWIFQRIATPIFNANQRWYGFHLAGLNEPLQVTQYRAEDQGFYEWHTDHTVGGPFSCRKLSMVIQLSDGYEGGAFELHGIGTPPELKRGAMVLFPSFWLHRVTPVTDGERWSMVTWVAGPPFV